jgi:hypothetical protein
MKNLRWIRNYKKPLNKNGMRFVKMVSITEQFIRKKGIRENSFSSVKKELLPILDITKRVKRVRGKILYFIKLESLKVGLGEKLLGCSEIIESTFGKLKEVEKEQSKSGFT